MAAAKPALKVVVGSTNPVKVQAARRCFEACFPGRSIEIGGKRVPSGVSDQPDGDRETLQGALNRARRVAELLREDGEVGPDEQAFAVGMEGGISTEAWTAEQARELGVEPSMHCFAWIVVLEVSSGKVGRARTGSFPIPPAMEALIKEGVELGEADDRVLGRSNSKQKSGCVGAMTHDLIDRTEYYVHAATLALSTFMRPRLFGAPAIAGVLEE